MGRQFSIITDEITTFSADQHGAYPAGLLPNSPATDWSSQVFEQIVELSDTCPAVHCHCAIGRDPDFHAVSQADEMLLEMAERSVRKWNS